MIVKKIKVGSIDTNCIIVLDETTGACAVVDPGDEATLILQEIEALSGRLEAIFLTHGHFDHMLAAQALKEATGAKLYMHESDLPFLESYNLQFQPRLAGSYRQPVVDVYLTDGMKIQVGKLTFTVLNTPGHSKGSCVLLCENHMFAGDTLFRANCGRCDLAGGSLAEMYQSLKRLHDLQGDYTVYPGHGPSTTLAEERRINPYMKEAFTQ